MKPFQSRKCWLEWNFVWILCHCVRLWHTSLHVYQKWTWTKCQINLTRHLRHLYLKTLIGCQTDGQTGNLRGYIIHQTGASICWSRAGPQANWDLRVWKDSRKKHTQQSPTTQALKSKWLLWVLVSAGLKPGRRVRHESGALWYDSLGSWGPYSIITISMFGKWQLSL